MLYEENKDITYISRWMRKPVKVFIKTMNRFGLRTEQMNKWTNIENKQLD